MRALAAAIVGLALNAGAAHGQATGPGSVTSPMLTGPIYSSSVFTGCAMAQVSRSGDVTIDWACVEDYPKGDDLMGNFAKVLQAIRNGTAKAK